jgi:hypothetical protein
MTSRQSCRTKRIDNILKTDAMAKYSPKASSKVEKVMHEMKEGKLRSGSGKKVQDRKQAIAIGLSEARKEGAKVPRKPASEKRESTPKRRSTSPSE